MVDIIDEEKKKGNISEILERKNQLIRPAVANVDQAMIVFAVKKPNPNLNLLDRFLVMMEFQNIETIYYADERKLLLSSFRLHFFFTFVASRVIH